LPAAIILGIVCGCLGALFINITVWNGVWRKKIVNTNAKKVIECIAVAFITASIFYAVVTIRKNNCKPTDTTESY
jgi:H+/Cl- antiporter ClcA